MSWRARILVLVLAVAAGAGGGLALAWLVAPPAEYETSPAALDRADKTIYLALAGDLYASEGDLERATQRLAALEVPADGTSLAGMIEEYLDGGGELDDVRNLARLAQDLGATGGILRVFGDPAAGPVKPTAAVTEIISTSEPPATPLPAASPELPSGTPGADAGFRVVERTATCGRPGRPGVIAVRVRDADGHGLAGVEVTVSWALGEDRFFTGLRPDRGPGYADFQMSLGNEYRVSLEGRPGEAAQGLLADLSSGICPSTSLSLDWQLIFQQNP